MSQAKVDVATLHKQYLAAELRRWLADKGVTLVIDVDRNIVLVGYGLDWSVLFDEEGES